MLRRLLWVAPLLLCSCIVSVGSSRDRSAAESGSHRAETAQVSPLERGLAVIRAGDISADVHFLASDDLEGRDTPSRGLRIAADYLRARVQQLGWQPGAGSEYFYAYKLVTKTLWPVRTYAAAEKDDMRVAFQEGTDYVFSARPFVDHRITGGVTFVGAARAQDLDGLDLTGKWALCRDEADVDWRARRSLAEAAGAVGVIVAAGPDVEVESFARRYERWTGVREGLTLDGPQDPGFPTLFLERHAVERLLEWSGDLDPSVGDDLSFKFTDTRTFDETGVVEPDNVCAFWPGTDPRLRDEIIVVTAHYDHIGKDAAGEIYNGADDNASGSAALLALARAIREAGGLRRSVLLMWVSGEEKGLLGSAAWARDPLLPDDGHVVANLNIDMVGRNAPDRILMTPSYRHPAYNQLSRFVENRAALEGFEEVGSADAYWGRSDHANFSKYLGVPVVFLFTDVHEDYHQLSDSADKLDYDKAARATRLALRVLFEIDG